jgi:hypothetical protein
MVVFLALALASSQICTDVKQQCQACTSSHGTQRCSNIGIACQSSIRVCQPKDATKLPTRPKIAKPKWQLAPQLRVFVMRQVS